LINLSSIADQDFVKESQTKAETLLERAQEIAGKLEQVLRKSLG
jgi:formiminotetrahydrofolate cyclodeaminase